MQIDFELILMVFVVLALFISIVLLYKLFLRHKITRIVIVILLIVTIISMIWFYIFKINDIGYNGSGMYIYGKVKVLRAYMNEIDVESEKTSFKSGGEGRITVKTSDNVKIIRKVNGKEENITIGNLKFGDIVQVFCKESSTSKDNKQVTAVKIIKLN